MKKIKINYRKNEFLLNESVLSTIDSYNGKPTPPTITISRVEGASIIKQFIKKNYPKLKVWTRSDSFSMGNSIDVYICNNDEAFSKVDEKIEKEIDDFSQSLRLGRFNGMIDMYEYSNKDRKTDDGIEFKSYCKYISVENKPKFGTVEWGVQRLATSGENKEDLLYYIDDNKKEKFLETINS